MGPGERWSGLRAFESEVDFSVLKKLIISTSKELCVRIIEQRNSLFEPGKGYFIDLMSFQHNKIALWEAAGAFVCLFVFFIFFYKLGFSLKDFRFPDIKGIICSGV